MDDNNLTSSQEQPPLLPETQSQQVSADPVQGVVQDSLASAPDLSSQVPQPLDTTSVLSDPASASLYDQPSLSTPVGDNQPISSESVPLDTTASPAPPSEVVQSELPVSPIPENQFLEQPSLSTPVDSSPVPPAPLLPNATNNGEKPFVYASGSGGSFFGKISPVKLIIGIISFIILVVIILFVVLPATRQNSQQVTLTYWGLWESPSIMQSTISDFERQNPTIHIQYSMEDPTKYSERLLTRSQLGTGPDIFRFHNTWVPMLSPILLPLSTDVISKDDFTKFYYPVMQKDLIRNGAIVGIPLEIDDLSLFVNNSIFQAAGAHIPTNWDQFVTTARALTVKDSSGKIKTAGAAMGTYDNITHAADIMSLLFLQNGADAAHLSRTQQNASDALDFYQSFAKGDQNVWDNSLDQSMTAFAKGNLAMTFGYTWDIFNIKNANPNLSFSVYSVPHLPGRNMTVASYWVEGISARSKHQKEAMLFLKFLAQKETMQTLYANESKVRLFGEPYPRTDMAQSLQSNTWVAPMIEQAPSADSSIFAGETFDTGIDAQMNAYLGNAIRSGFVGTSADSAIQTLGQGIDQVLGQYGIQ